MKKPSFRFLSDLWFDNKDLRLCSPAARGFFVDLLALMSYEQGYLTRNGQPLTDANIASLTGHQVKDIKKWMIELGANGIYSVDAQGRMYSSRMVKDAGFVEKAVAAGQRGQVKKKAKSEAKKSSKVVDPEFLTGVASGREIAEAAYGNSLQKTPLTLEEAKLALNRDGKQNPAEVEAMARKVLRPVKAKQWWETAAGWAKTGQQQAISPKPGEDVEEFKYRVAERLGDGPHVVALAPHCQTRLKAKIEKEAAIMKAAGPQ